MSRLAIPVVSALVALAGCTLSRAAAVSVSPEPVPEVSPAPPPALPAVTAAEIADAHARLAAEAAEEAEAQEAAAEEEMSGADDGTGADDDELAGVPSADEGESHEAQAPAGTPEIRYTADLADTELERLWKETPESLGSIAIGYTDEGRLVNGERFPEGEGWMVVDPERTYATKEVVDAVVTAIREVRTQFPNAPPLRVNQISAREGGWLRPHKSHQNGRDVDLAFYYPTAEPVRVRAREKYIDAALTWALVKAMVTRTDVQMVLLDRRVQKVLYDHALQVGEDRAWLDWVFNGPAPLVQHARRHRDHLHVRFFSPRAQEAGEARGAPARDAAGAERPHAPGAAGGHAGGDRGALRQHGGAAEEEERDPGASAPNLPGAPGAAAGAVHEVPHPAARGRPRAPPPTAAFR